MSDYTKQLQAVFEELVRLQTFQPQYHHSIEILHSSDEFQEGEHCYFFSNVGRVLTNRPQIGIGFKFSNEQENQFKKLDIFSEFVRNNEDANTICYDITLTDDAINAAYVFKEVVENIFAPHTMPILITTTNKNLIRDKKSLKAFFANHLPMMFCFDLPKSTHLSQIETQFSKTKTTVEKYGFGKVEFSEEESCVKGYYQPTEEPTGFFASIKHGGKMGDCEGELIHLLSRCYDSFK